MLQGLQCFDFLGEGMISKVDMKRVLAEFGMSVGAIEFDTFLSRYLLSRCYTLLPFAKSNILLCMSHTFI